MKNIILDHFRRWRWAWLLGGIVYGFVTMGICAPDDHPKFSGVFPLGFFLGAFLLSIDLQRGHTRALLALPVSAKQIGRAWWWVSVGIPVLILGAITALVIGIMLIIAALAHTKPILIGNGVNYWLTTTLLLGTMFFALTGMTCRPGGAVDWRERTRSILFGLLWGGTIGLWFFFKEINLQTTAGVIAFAITSILTVIGWFRAETLVQERGGFRNAFQSSSSKTAKPSRCAEGRGGLRFLAQLIFNRMTLIGLAMFGAFILIFGMVMVSYGLSNPSDRGGKNFAAGILNGEASMFTFQFLWIMSFQVFQVAFHVRFLRTLPVSVSKLAGVLVFMPLLAMLVVIYSANLLVAAMLQSPPLSPAEMFHQGFFLQIAMAVTFIPVLVWRGLDRLTYFLMIMVLMMGMFSSLFLKNQLSAPISSAITLLLISGSFTITKLLLERNSATYRPRTNVFAGWQWGAGR